MRWTDTSTKNRGNWCPNRRVSRTWRNRPAALFDTRAAMLWDDEYLYVGFWLEEPDVRATHTTRDSMICEENDVEVFIAGENSYYEFELNALGTIMERFYVWQDAYIEAGYASCPNSICWVPGRWILSGGPQSGFKHPRGRRWAFREWDMPGLQWAVQVDGTINDSSDTDRGWTAEIAFPCRVEALGGRALAASPGRGYMADGLFAFPVD